jgi:hypothetical protein
MEVMFEGLTLQDPADADQVQPVGGQRADIGEPADILAGATRAAGQVQQSLRS